MKSIQRILSIAVILSFSILSWSQESIVFIYDASGSMWGKIENETKIEIANNVLTTTVETLADSQSIGLVAYGHRREKDCNDIEWLLDMDNLSKGKVDTAVSAIKPKGRTPLARSAKFVMNELQASGKKATIILITDGIESCDGDICEVVKAAKSDSIYFKMHIVGFGLKGEDIASLRCAAENANGRYFEAEDGAGLATALQQATASTVELPEENLSIAALKNGQAIDAYVKCIHTESLETGLILRTYGDTVSGYVEPGTYNISVQPLGGSDLAATTLENVVIPEGEEVFKSVSFDAGFLKITGTLNGDGWDCLIKVTEQATGNNVASARSYGKTEVLELVPGGYNVNISALRLEGITSDHNVEGVRVSAGDTALVTHDFATGKLSVKSASGDILIDATVKILDDNDQQVGGGRTYSSPSSNPKEFLLSPGKYKVKLDALPLKGPGATVVLEDIEIAGGEKNELIHNFEYGRLFIKVNNAFGLSDAVVKIMDETGKTVYASARTYKSETSNPRDFLLTPGKYKIEVDEVGKDASTEKTIDVEIKAGDTLEKEVTF